MKLCGRCAAMKRASGVKLRRVNETADEKVDCRICGCRRYGGEFEIDNNGNSKKKAKEN